MEKKWQKIVRVVCAVIYIVSWLAFSLGFIMYYTILKHINHLQLLDTAGVLILLPMLSFSIPGLAIGVLIVFQIISRKTNRKHIYMALIMLFSVPYLTGGGVTIFMAAAFLGTIQHGSMTANGVPIEWVSLVMISCVTSISSYWLSLIFAALSNVEKLSYRSHELHRTVEYERIQ